MVFAKVVQESSIGRIVREVVSTLKQVLPKASGTVVRSKTHLGPYVQVEDAIVVVAVAWEGGWRVPCRKSCCVHLLRIIQLLSQILQSQLCCEIIFPRLCVDLKSD